MPSMNEAMRIASPARAEQYHCIMRRVNRAGRAPAKLLTKDEVRRMAAHFVKL